RLGQRALPVGEPPGPVMAVRLSIGGMRGGRGGDRSAQIRYLLIVDVSDLPAGVPPMWVRAPLDRDITHVNIWPASKSVCPWTGTPLPSLCWNTFAVAWQEAPSAQRTLGSALEFARQLLNTENHESPAR
ncbi:hypothetical protein, partial [Allorhizocola rhizosphaerae]|uniref:hypothetical protein n=1 Tax=Allorhizocola rhizosphaerae TaxID=1872709 RepID=UPI0013C37915